MKAVRRINVNLQKKDADLLAELARDNGGTMTAAFLKAIRVLDHIQRQQAAGSELYWRSPTGETTKWTVL